MGDRPDGGFFDVVVVGGGPAGLTGALTLARARRGVLVLDAGEQRNAAAEGVHGLLTRDGMSPRELIGLGAQEVRRYGGEVRTATVTAVRRIGGGFEVETEDGSQFSSRRVLLTTGLADELPDLPGVGELWGTGVLHCPYCHGWEMRDRAIGVLGRGDSAVHQALAFRQWSGDITFFRHRLELSDQDRDRLQAFGVRIVEGEVERLEISDGRLSGVQLTGGRLVPVEALVIGTRLTARSELAVSLGLEPIVEEEGGHVAGSYVAADPDGRTQVPGVWVAGNVSDLAAQVITAAAAGLRAAASINTDLVDEDVETALREYRKNTA